MDAVRKSISHLIMRHPQVSDSSPNRREFLDNSVRNAAGIAAGVLAMERTSRAHPSSREQLRLGMIGLGDQGQKHVQTLQAIDSATITAICDVDGRNLALAQHQIVEDQGTRPIAITQYEKLLERNDVDAVVISTPDHWHAQMVIDACQAGKHVYLEQPVGHSIIEGEQMCSAARESGTLVQTGLPQRSAAHYQSAINVLRAGTIGPIHHVKAWAVHRRKSIGHGTPTSSPRGVDYMRWLGSAPKRDFQSNRFHRNWPWFWDYGSGELGIWGVHMLDVARWGLGVDTPERVLALGGMRHFDDDRETPDTLQVLYRFGNVDVCWEHRQWSQHGIEGRMSGTAFYGADGTLIVDRSGWKVYGHNEQLYADASEMKLAHMQNFLDAVRGLTELNANIMEGHLSAAMCHWGNMSFLQNRELQIDPKTRQVKNM